MTQTIITPEEGAEAHRLNVEIQERLIDAERHFLAAGRSLARMLDQKLYAALGYDSFEDYLPSVKLSITHGWRLVRTAKRTERLARAAMRTPEILGHVAETTGMVVSTGTARAMAERAVLSMGIANADRVLGKALDASDASVPDVAREWLEKGAGLREIDVERELGRARRGGTDDARYDYLVGVKRRGQALLAELPSMAVGDILAHVASIHDLLKEVAAWCAEYTREESRNGHPSPLRGPASPGVPRPDGE